MGLDLISKRAERGEVKLSIPAECLLTRLLGRRYFTIHGVSIKEKKWKRILVGLLKSLKRSIDLAMDTDAVHKAEVNRYLYIIEQSVESKDTTDPEIILSLLGICYELLGGLPDNRKKKIINNHKNNYKTDKMRTLHFIRSPQQKFNVIMQSALHDEFKSYYSEDELWGNFRGDMRDFISWFKNEYPEAYGKLF